MRRSLGSRTSHNQMIAAGDTPAIWARVTKSLSLIASASPGIIRAMPAHVVAATAMIILVMLTLMITIIIIATKSDGKPITAPVIRMMTLSTRLKVRVTLCATSPAALP